MELTLRIPKEVGRALKVPGKEKESFLLKELAISLYQQDILSFGKARQLANMSKWEFHNELGKRKIARHYTIEDFEEDLRYAKDRKIGLSPSLPSFPKFLSLRACNL